MADEPRSVVPPAERPTAAGNVGLPIVGLPARLLGGTAIQITRQGLGATVSLDIGKLEQQSGLDPAQTWVPCWTESGHHFRVPVNIIPVDAPLDGDLYGRQSGVWVPIQGALTFDWSAIQNKPTTFPPTLPIAQGDVTGLTGRLADVDSDIAALEANSRGIATVPEARAAVRDDVDMTPYKTGESVKVNAELADFTPNGSGAVVRSLRTRMRETPVSVKDYGAIGNGVAVENAAFNAALDQSSALFLSVGDYLLDDYATILRTQAASVTGPGRLLITLSGNPAERLGRTIRAGVKDASGYLGLGNQGGFALSEEGKGPRLYATANGWAHVEPERLGERVYFQLYSGAYFGIATATPGTGNIVSSYGFYSVGDVEVGDFIGFAGKMYKIGAIPSYLTFTLTETNGAPVVFGSAVNGSWFHSYTYSDGNLIVSGTTATYVSGDMFHYGNQQARLKLNAGATIDLTPGAYFTDERHIVLPSPPGDGNYAFRLKTIDSDFGVTSLVLQGVEGGTETNALFTLDAMNRLIIARQFSGLGDYGPIILRTGPNSDLGERDHLQISASGTIQMGGNPAVLGTPAKVGIHRDVATAPTGGGTTGVNLLQLSANFNGAAFRYGLFFIPNDFFGLCIQGGAPGAGGALRLQPYGDNVGIGASALTPSTRLDVGGPIRTRPFTAATLPSASAVGDGTVAFASDVSSGVLVYARGGTWRRVSDDTTI